MERITISTPDLVSFTEAARQLKVSRPTIYNMIARNELHPITIGANRYLLRNEVERLKDEE